MATSSFAKIILSRLTEELRSRGFRRSGSTFVRPVNDCYQIVNLQASQFGTSARQRYTINLAVYSSRVEPLTKEAAKLKDYDGHWRARISEFQEDSRDQWWEVASDEEAKAAGDAMARELSVLLEAMDGISSYEAILALPRGPGASCDDPPGGIYRRAAIDAAREREALPPSEAPEFIEGWRSTWHRRHYPDYVRPEIPKNPLLDALKRSRELGKSLPDITLVTKDGVAPMADPDEI